MQAKILVGEFFRDKYIMAKNLGVVLIYFAGLQVIFWRFTADKKLEQNQEKRKKVIRDD